MERPNKINAANLAALLAGYVSSNPLRLGGLVPDAYALTSQLQRHAIATVIRRLLYGKARASPTDMNPICLEASVLQLTKALIEMRRGDPLMRRQPYRTGMIVNLPVLTNFRENL